MHQEDLVGRMTLWKVPEKNLDALFKLIETHVPTLIQTKKKQEPFKMLATTLSGDNFLGRLLTGRVETGTLKTGQSIKAINRDGELVETFRVNKILAFRGL